MRNYVSCLKLQKTKDNESYIIILFRICKIIEKRDEKRMSLEQLCDGMREPEIDIGIKV